tara:strand:+ start:1187 stop:1477 length:291 start_codon:yes stop_codon:yes gene_type:complete
MSNEKELLSDVLKLKIMKERETIALGEIALVENTEAHNSANDEYYLVYLDGLFAKANGDPAPYMFTVADLSYARTRAAKNVSDLRPMKTTKWWKFW